MAKRFRIAGGKAAIWDGATDMLPFSAPRSYLSRVKFHTDLDYDGAVSVWDSTISLPSRNVLSQTYNITLFAHGQAGTPYVEAAIQIGGQWTRVAGHLPIAVSGRGFFRAICIGADATNVIMTDFVVASNAYTQPGVGGVDVIYTGNETYAAQSLPAKVYVMDTLL